MDGWLRPAAALAAALLAGLGLGLLKGDGDPLRAAVGNLSAPWLLMALVPAWWAGSWWRGALVGTAATALGLVGFYGAMTVVLHGHFGGASGWVDEFLHVLVANRIWFGAGLLSGPVLGALGGAVGRGGPHLLALVAGGFMAAEPAVVAVVSGVRIPVLGVSWATPTWTPYLAQAAVGSALVCGVAWWRRHPVRSQR